MRMRDNMHVLSSRLLHLQATTAAQCKRLLHACLLFSRRASSTGVTANDWLFRPLASDVDITVPTYIKDHVACELERFREHRKPKTTSSVVPSGVLVPLCVCNDRLSLLYTRRTSNVASHRRQVSFPGGMYEEGDVDLVRTALRETEEEIGIDRSSVDVWGNMPRMMASGRKSAVPVVGFVGNVTLDELKTNRDEVESVFAVSLLRLSDPLLRVTTKFRQGYEMPVFLGGQYRVWGLTAIITDYLLHVLCGAEIESRNIQSMKCWDDRQK
ncbi:mitochondrial coenzyme A diphosphatase NUDT8-like [Corticium candelabrum]|uniref:mitochondrial coenzyme A diphosphatase NUDT8-like n=1 Tax=Corticium candelabrum TaxID=121492 RepID=UPI002E25ACDE|nr:mitochondrial coenzyme A diphosphatase NUDT8-like [Corticium candelabrum]